MFKTGCEDPNELFKGFIIISCGKKLFRSFCILLCNRVEKNLRKHSLDRLVKFRASSRRFRNSLETQSRA